MDINVILEKEKQYNEKLNSLLNFNIEEEVEKRMKDQIEKVRNEIISEMKKDIDRCNHYLEILNELKTEAYSELETAEEDNTQVTESISEEA